MGVSPWQSHRLCQHRTQPAALFAQVFQADIATLEASKNELEVGTDTVKPGEVLINEVCFCAPTCAGVAE